METKYSAADQIISPVSECIRKTRERLGVSQAELSERTRIPLSDIQRYEGAHFTPDLGHILRIADALGVKPREVDPRPNP